jgi:hypothetical protein
VALLAEGERAAGEQLVAFSCEGLAPGVYMYRLSAGARSAARTLVVTR